MTALSEVLSVIRHAATRVDMAADDAPNGLRDHMRRTAHQLRGLRDEIEALGADLHPGMHSPEPARMHWMLGQLLDAANSIREAARSGDREALLGAAMELADYVGANPPVLGTALVPWSLLKELRARTETYRAALDADAEGRRAA